MRLAIRALSQKIKNWGVGLFYYAGHGVQIDGINYLVPIGADIHDTIDVDDQCLKASYILRAMENAENKLINP